MEQTVTYGDARITVKRRTVLLKARFDALINKMAGVFNVLVKEAGEDSSVVDRVMTTYARISAQAVSHEQLPFELLLPSDGADVLMHKCRTFLLSEDIDPELVTKVDEAIDTVNGSWEATGEKKAKTMPAPSSNTGSESAAAS